MKDLGAGFPEWTELGQAGGLDPLGMQRPIEAIYQSLLPGISTITLRFRYYSFFVLAFNNYLAVAGFSISRMEVTKTAGARTGRRFDYDILVLPEDDDGWAIFANPARSRAHVVDIVDHVVREGGTFEFLVWAEIPSD